MLKNLLQSPRPPHKIIWVNKGSPELDPGFPSTHTMTAFTIPWYLLIFYWDSISDSTKLMGIAILLMWSCSIALSRIYNGHHFIIDVCGGFCLAVLITVVWTQYLRYIADSIIFNPSLFYPLAILAVEILLLYIHPQALSPNPATAETALVFGTCTGTMVGVWLHKNSQVTIGFGYKILPTLPIFSDLIALMAARFVIGILVVAIVREASKQIFLPIILYSYNHFLNFQYTSTSPGLQPKKILYNKTNYKHSAVDVVLKLVTYFMVSFSVVASPHLCCMLGLFHESDLLIFI